MKYKIILSKYNMADLVFYVDSTEEEAKALADHLERVFEMNSYCYWAEE